MRIAYLAYWNAFRRDGVVKKIETQASEWRRREHEVAIFCVTPQPTVTREPAFQAYAFPFHNLWGRFIATQRMVKSAARFQPDVVYLRYDLFLPPIWPFLRQQPVVVELNEQPAEYALRASRARLFEPLNRRALLRRADGLVCIAQELAESRGLSSATQRRIVIGNGIDLNDFRSLPAPGNSRPRGVFLGAPGLPWHGVDKIRLLAEKLPEVDFDLIGPPGSELGGPAPSNLTIHGFLDRSAYEPVLAHADFAIGTLALHRQGINETSPLKLREYLAYGLPVILAHRDPDLPAGESWFVLRLPNTEGNVVDHLADVRAFISATRGRRVSRSEVADLISSTKKEEARLDFMSSVASRSSEKSEPASA